jgi:hypothetical protein
VWQRHIEHQTGDADAAVWRAAAGLVPNERWWIVVGALKRSFKKNDELVDVGGASGASPSSGLFQATCVPVLRYDTMDFALWENLCRRASKPILYR